MRRPAAASKNTLLNSIDAWTVLAPTREENEPPCMWAALSLYAFKKLLYAITLKTALECVVALWHSEEIALRTPFDSYD